MPRRTSKGRELYRRCLGFRLYMVTAEQDRQRFYEQEGIFEEYLPYAIVFHCVDKWAEVFKELGLEKQKMSWYVGPGGSAFNYGSIASLQGFTSGVSSAMSNVPGGGGSGFSGSSGGGFGGGGGGSW